MGTRKFTAEQPFEMDPRHACKYYLFDRLERIGNRLFCECRSSREWLRITQDPEARFSAELVTHNERRLQFERRAGMFQNRNARRFLTLSRKRSRRGITKRRLSIRRITTKSRLAALREKFSCWNSEGSAVVPTAVSGVSPDAFLEDCYCCRVREACSVGETPTGATETVALLTLWIRDFHAHEPRGDTGGGFRVANRDGFHWRTGAGYLLRFRRNRDIRPVIGGDVGPIIQIG